MQRGFSLIELAVTMSIIAVLMMLGMPSLTEYINNARLGSAAQSYYSGLSRARSEAIRMNRRVEFAITNTPIAPGIENTLVADTGGQNWVVRSRETGSASYDTPYIEARSSKDGAGINPSVTVTATTSIVAFDGFGAANATAGEFRIENPTAGLCVPAGPVRCWRVVVGASGQVRLCDPAAGIGDTRSCGP